MPKPVCLKCKRFFRLKTSGYYFVEGRPLVQGAQPGQPEGWGPYKLWASDMYECPSCGFQMATGFGLGPIAEHYQHSFAEKVEEFGATTQINDC